MNFAHLEHDLFLMLFNLSQVTDEMRIKTLFIESMNSLKKDLELRFVDNKEDIKGEAIEVATLQNKFGFIDLRTNPDSIGESEKALIRNSITLLAVLIEKQRQDKILSDETILLKKLVSERTWKLELSNIEMQKEINERKKIAKELEESKLFVQRILETTPNLIYIYDLVEKKTVFSNKNITKVMGYDKQQLQEMGPCVMGTLIHPDDFPAVASHHQQLSDAKDNTVLEISYRILHADGSWRWMSCRDLPFSRSDDGQVIRILGIAHDITQEIESQKTKLKLESQLRQSHKMEAIGTMAGGIAHDFNNILGIILGNTELALDDLPQWSPANESLMEIKQASLRAKEIIQQLLSFTRKTNQKKTVLPVKDLVTETIRLLRASIPATIDLKTQIQEDAGFIEADSTLIHQVLINLCTNAVHAMKNGGSLEIDVSTTQIETQTSMVNRTLTPGDYIKLTVSDTGTGIQKEIQDKIFDPYFTTKEVGKGTGMGLAVVHGIVDNHNGAISIYSEPDRGTCVHVFLPKSALPQEKPHVSATAHPEGNETILFVDDEISLTLLICQTLTRLGYHVETCTDPFKAFALFSSDPAHFDLVITDMTMPGMTGDQLAQKILNIKKDIPIILCSGFSKILTQEQAQKIGVNHYLEKPFDKNQLARAVRNAIDGFGKQN
ncbi:MAG: ATP-binding protein [Pseudomonadota bacterium]